MLACGSVLLSLSGTRAAEAQGAEEAAANAPAPQQGQSSGIEEIVVRGAESEASSDFASGDSVVGFGAEDLAALGASDISDLAAFTPNLEIVTSGATTPTFFIRGVGLNDFNANSTGAVAIYQDDVARNAPALQLSTLFDVEAVNVLRGPQGTGLARNASAGAIKVYSRKPSGDFGGFFRTDVGNFDALDLEGAVEAPIYEDILAARFAFRRLTRDGTMKNRCGDKPRAGRRPAPTAGAQRRAGLLPIDRPWSQCGEPVASRQISALPEGLKNRVNNSDVWAARGTLLFQPTLDTTFLLNAHGARRDELSRLGQSIGTRGDYCRNGDLANCQLMNPNSSFVSGLLGGLTGQGLFNQGYVPREIRERYAELAPCTIGVPLFATGTCGSTPALQQQLNDAKIQIAEELAKKLDSKPWEGDFNRTGPTTNDTWGGFLNGEAVLPLGLKLTSVTGYDAYKRTIDIDLDFSPETLFHILTEDEGWQVTQDLKLEGAVGDEAQLRWEVGGWVLRESLDVSVDNDLGIAAAFAVGSRDYVQDLWSAAGYATVAWDFWEDFTLDGGFRYNWERKKLDYDLLQNATGVTLNEQLDENWQEPTGTIRLTYRFREDTHAFWKYTRGWKPGTYNATSSPSQGVSIARPETIDAFETGLAGSWFQGRVGLDFSLFYYSYKDYQLFTAQQFAGGQPEFVILNADKVEVYGAEVDFSARPWAGAFVNVRFGWLETQFLEFVQEQQERITQSGASFIVTREVQNTGNPLLNSPKYKVTLTAEQTIPLGRWGTLTPRYDGVWTDVTHYDASSKGRGLPNTNNEQFLPKGTTNQRDFWLHNLRLAWRAPVGNIEVAGWVRNVANEAYKTFAFDASTFNNTSIYFVGDPRTYGGTLTVNF